MIKGRNITLRKLEEKEAHALYTLRNENRHFFQPFEPIRGDEQFTLDFQLKTIEDSLRSWKDGIGYSFGIFLNEKEQLIGRINITNVARGAFQSANLGYFLDQNENGKGYMTEALILATNYAFKDLRLHRLQAAIMPKNKGSIRVVEKAGFIKEGFAPFYLSINGVWEGHMIYSLTTENWIRKSAD